VHREHFWDFETQVASANRAEVQAPSARRIIVAIAILHNIAIRWTDDEPVGGHSNHGFFVVPEQQYEIIADDAEPVVVRAPGQQLRNQLCDNMLP
jgi:hypothetical protein